MRKFTDMVNESKKSDSGYVYDRGCIMMSFDIENWNDILGEIKDEDIYKEDGYGLEDESHITLLWGILHGVETEDIRKMLEFIPQPYVELKDITIFQNGEFDVVKFDIDCDMIMGINSSLSTEFPNKNTHPVYHPHMTIAYVKPGRGVYYIKSLEKSIVLKPTKIIYSVATGTTKKEVVDLRKW